MSKIPSVVVVTGAGAGAGRAIAERFGREGWRVALLGRDLDRLEAAQAAIELRGGEGLPLAVDVSDYDAVTAARDKVVETWGGVDVWINCAMATLVGPVTELSPKDFQRVMEVTLMGYVHGTKAALEVMVPRNCGRIIQIGSALAYRAIPLQSAYCAAKFAIRGFTDSLRSELIHAESAVTLSMLQMPGMNTIQFDWAKNLFPKKYRPVGEVYDPDVAADAAWRAAHEGNRELWVGKSAIEAIVGNLLFPPLLDRVLSKSAYQGQISDIPEDPGRSNNLYHSIPGDYGARGRFGKEARPEALTVDATRLRLAAGAAGGALLLGLLVAALNRGRSPDL